MADWVASGPDEFGDFHISSKGEQLAKCVVVQNGFRSPAETKSIAVQVIKAVNHHEDLVKALEVLCDELACDEQHGDDADDPDCMICRAYKRATRVLADVGGSGQ